MFRFNIHSLLFVRKETDIFHLVKKQPSHVPDIYLLFPSTEQKQYKNIKIIRQTLQRWENSYWDRYVLRKWHIDLSNWNYFIFYLLLNSSYIRNTYQPTSRRNVIETYVNFSSITSLKLGGVIPEFHVFFPHSVKCSNKLLFESTYLPENKTSPIMQK